MNNSTFTTSLREKIILEKIIDLVIKYFDPPRIFIFGSRSKGNFSKHTDFDIAIDIEEPTLNLHRKFLEEIDTIAGLYSVDIVYLKSVEGKFRDVILSTGKIIYEK